MTGFWCWFNNAMVGDLSLKKFLILLGIFLVVWVLMKMGDDDDGEEGYDVKKV